MNYEPTPWSMNTGMGGGSSFMPSQFASMSNYGAPTTDYSLTGMGGFNQGAIATAPAVASNIAPNSFTEWAKSIGMLGGTAKDGMKTDGWGGLALGAAQGLGSLYMGMQQYNLAKDTLANNKAQFERNFAAQKTTTNASLEDRQRARVASNGSAYQSVGDYMSQNGIK